MIEDGDAAIEPFVDFDGGFGVAATARARQELDRLPVPRDGVGIVDGAEVLEAEDGLRIAPYRPGPKGRRRIRRRLREAAIEAGQELRQVGIGPGPVCDAGEAELAAQSILEGLKEPLDASFRLGAARGDPADAQFGEGPGDLCGRGVSGELLGERERVLRPTMEDAVAVAVDRDGDSMAVRQLLEQGEVAMGILGVAEGGRQNGAGRIVDRSEQHEAWTACFEPVVIAAVDLHQQAGLRHAFPAPPVARGATFPGAPDARSAEEAGDRLA